MHSINDHRKHLIQSFGSKHIKLLSWDSSSDGSWPLFTCLKAHLSKEGFAVTSNHESFQVSAGLLCVTICIKIPWSLQRIRTLSKANELVSKTAAQVSIFSEQLQLAWDPVYEFSCLYDQVIFEIAGSRDASVILWDVDQGKPVATLKGHKYQVDLSYEDSPASWYCHFNMFHPHARNHSLRLQWGSL